MNDTDTDLVPAAELRQRLAALQIGQEGERRDILVGELVKLCSAYQKAARRAEAALAAIAGLRDFSVSAGDDELAAACGAATGRHPDSTREAALAGLRRDWAIAGPVGHAG